MNAVVSLGFGDEYSRMADVTHPFMKRYARKTGADFIRLTERKHPKADHPTWEKLQMRDVLKDYERVLWLDTDVIIRSNAPNIFDEVPPGWLGAVDEFKQHDIRRIHPHGFQEMFEQCCFRMGLQVPWPGYYWNGGMMVVDRAHVRLLDDPPVYFGREGLWDQTMLNVRLAQQATPFKDLPVKFNHTFFSKGDRGDAWFVHYCGCRGTLGWAIELPPGENSTWLMKSDLVRWGEGVIPE